MGAHNRRKFAVIKSNNSVLLPLIFWFECGSDDKLSSRFYFRSKNKPMIANAIPTILCHDSGSRKEKNPRDGHERRAASQNCWNRRKRPAFLKKEKERDRASSDANSGNQRVSETGSAEFLSRSSRKPENRQIDQDRQCGAGFDNETAETLADALGRETCKNLVCAVKHGGKDRIPEPSCHETNLVYEMDHSREN